MQGRKVSKVVKTTVVRGERVEKQTGDSSLAADLPSAREDFEKVRISNLEDKSGSLKVAAGILFHVRNPPWFTPSEPSVLAHSPSYRLSVMLEALGKRWCLE